MNLNYFPQVWFADEKRNRSVTKMIVFSDKGSLEIKTDSLEFTGKKSKIQISNIKEISLARQRINWIMYLIMNIFLIIYFAFIMKVNPDVFSYSFLFLLLLTSNAFGLIVGYSTKWIQVSYLDENNRTVQAFFADGSSLGWSGIFGGTEKMYQMLKSLTNREESAVL